MSDERLDQLIDDVARQMTRGQLSSDFRARVIASLDRRPRRVWRPMWIVAPLGAMAAVVLAIAITRPFHPSTCSGCPERAEGQGRDRGTPASAPRQSGQTSSPPGGFGGRGKADTTYEGPRGTRVAAAGRRQDRSSGAAEVAALAPPPLEMMPLGVEAIGIDALPTESIAVPQLNAIAPMSIDPLPTDEGRPPDGANDDPIDHRP